MAKKKKNNSDRFPDITKEHSGELALLCLRRCEHYYGTKQIDNDLKVTDEDLADYVRILFKDEWGSVNLKKDLSSYDTTQFIKIKFLGAIGLHAADPNELADPYIRIAYNNVVYFTSVKTNTLNPCWNESLLIGPVKPDDVLEVEIWDWDPRTFFGNVAKVKEIHSLRGLGLYLKELCKCRVGDDYLGGVHFNLREARSRRHLFRRDVRLASETSGTLSFHARFQCAEDDLPHLYQSHYFLLLHMLLKVTPSMEQMCIKQILSAADRALLRRLAIGLSSPLKTICRLRAVHKAIVKYSLQINGVVMYDLALDLAGARLTSFETVELNRTCSALHTLIRRLLTFKSFIPQTVTARIHLMGILSLCAALRKVNYHGAIASAEDALNAFIKHLGKQRSTQLAQVKVQNNPLPIIMDNLKVTTNLLRKLSDIVQMTWSRHLSEVTRESLEAFAVGYGDWIGMLTNPEDALKPYQVLKVFCDDFKIPVRLLRRCFSETTLQAWMEGLGNEAPYWSRYVAQQDLIFANTISSTSGQLLSKPCEEFLSRLHHNLAGIYEMTSKSLNLSEIYARSLCTCGLQYVTQLALATEDQKLLSPTGYTSGFNRKVCVVLNNMASTHALIVADLEEMVESREETERKQWKYLSSVGDDIFHRWNPRPILTEIRKIFETTAEEFAERLADDVSDMVVTICESTTVEEVRKRAKKLDRLLVALFDALRTATYPSLFRILIGRMYEITLDNLAEIVANIRMPSHAERVVFSTAVLHCCDVLEAFFLDEKHALPHHKVKTPRHAWVRDTATKLAERESTESSVSFTNTGKP